MSYYTRPANDKRSNAELVDIIGLTAVNGEIAEPKGMEWENDHTLKFMVNGKPFLLSHYRYAELIDWLQAPLYHFLLVRSTIEHIAKGGTIPSRDSYPNGMNHDQAVIILNDLVDLKLAALSTGQDLGCRLTAAGKELSGYLQSPIVVNTVRDRLHPRYGESSVGRVYRLTVSTATGMDGTANVAAPWAQ